MAARIYLAGRIVVTVNGEQADERALGGGQPRLVLALLVRFRHRPVTRDELAENLWPRDLPHTWETALRGVVGRVRGFLVSAGLGDAAVVRGAAGVYHVQLPADLDVDVERAAAETSAAERAREAGDAHAARDLATRARAVLGRPLLAGVEAPWLTDERQALSGLLLRALECLAGARLALGEAGHAVGAAEEAVALDPFRESAYRLLIRAHVETGNQAAGLWVYERCRQLLATELGADPAPETQALHTAILRSGAVSEPIAPPPSVAVTEPATDQPAAKVCPYRGLQTYEESDAAYFCGRSGDVTRLLERVEGRRFLAVLGPSGSGKSSLVRAGLVPALRRGALPGADTWAVRTLRPGAVPLKTLARELAELHPRLDEAAIARRLIDDPQALLRLADAARGGHAAASAVVLVVDQLEEAFTLCDDTAQRQAFLDALTAAATSPPGRTVVVVTLRADYYPRLAEHPRLADLASAHQFLVTPMDEVGLAEAIEGPARAVELELEQGLTETVLRDVARQPGSLPLLSHCLLELWQQRAGGTLTLSAYREIGGVAGALARGAEAVYGNLSPEQQAVARGVLLRLTQPGEGSADTRRRVTFAELPTRPDEHDIVEAVVARLTDARLLTTGGPPDGQRWVELSHEALIRGWPRLQGWVDDDRAGLRVHRRLSAAAAEWERLERDEGALYRGAVLAEGAAWADAHPDAANPLERAFVDASTGLEEAQRRRRQRRLRLALSALAGGLVVVTVLAVVALLQRERAEQQQHLALSRAVSAEAVNQLSIEPGLGLALAVEAVEIAATREAVAALRQALVTPHPRLAVPGGRRDFAVHPAGTQVVVGGDDGAARVWDLTTGELLHRLGGHRGLVITTSFSPDGRYLVTTDEAGARVWDAADGSLAHKLPHTAMVLSVNWSPDGRWIVTAGMEGVIHRWEVDSGTHIEAIEAPGAVSFTQLSADGETMLAWSALDPELFVLDPVGGTQLAVLEGHEAAAVDARVSPDGRYALSMGLDATARFWDLRAGVQAAVLDGFADRVWVGRFSADGNLVVIGDDVGAVRVAEVPSGRTVFEQTAHTGVVVGAAFSPDDAVVVTVSTDGTALVWDIATGAPREVLRLDGAAGLGLEARAVAFTPDGGQILTRASRVQAWDVPPGPSMVLRGHERVVSTLAFSSDGALLATGSADGTLWLWEVASGAERGAIEVPDSAIGAASFSLDGSRLVIANPFHAATSERDLPPGIWEVASRRRLATLPVPAPTQPPCPLVCQTNTVAHSPDGTVMATAGQEGVVRLWDGVSGEPLGELEPAGRMLRDVAFSPDGRMLAGAAWQRVAVWNVATGALIHDLPAPAMAVAFDAAGYLLAAAGDDGAATLWDPEHGRLVGELRHASTVTDVAWSGDSRFLVTGTGDGAHLWSVETQQRIQSFPGHVGAVGFTRDDAIVIGTGDGTVHVHRCAVCGAVEDLLDAARRRVIRELSPAERERFLQVTSG